MAERRSGPGPLLVVHRLTMTVSLGGAIGYALYEFSQGTAGSGWRGGIATVIALGIGLYLIANRDLGARLTPNARRESGGDP